MVVTFSTASLKPFYVETYAEIIAGHFSIGLFPDNKTLVLKSSFTLNHIKNEQTKFQYPNRSKP
jgi:hypothetical protein